MDIKPIETVYNGYRFRSRLEARWAVFFNALNIKYEYEPEGFVLSDGTYYLPDFYLPESKTFFEVKGIMSDKDMHKIKKLIKDSQRPVVIGCSDMSFYACDFWWDEDFALTDKESSVLVHCPTCGKYYFSGINGSYECLCCGDYDGDHNFYIVCYGDWENERLWKPTDEVLSAIHKARQARFEHGEMPTINKF